MAVDAPTQKCVAALRRLMPERTAATIRSRKSLEYGRPIEAGLHPCQHLEPVAFGSDCKNTKIEFFASSGDLSGVQYPSVLTNVVSVGGTQIDRDSGGNLVDRSIWYLSDGGFSQYVPLPAFQSAIAGAVKRNVRGVPDVALDASSASGVWVYGTPPYGGQVLGWVVVAGTSVASPSAAAIANSAGYFSASSAVELVRI